MNIAISIILGACALAFALLGVGFCGAAGRMQALGMDEGRDVGIGGVGCTLVAVVLAFVAGMILVDR